MLTKSGSTRMWTEGKNRYQIIMPIRMMKERTKSAKAVTTALAGTMSRGK